MFIVIYRWSLREGEGTEERFRQCWRQITKQIRRDRGSLGSRLHKAEDGTWVAYAQWPLRQAWAAARTMPPKRRRARKMMEETVEIRYPPLCMEVMDDLLDDGVCEVGTS